MRFIDLDSLRGQPAFESLITAAEKSGAIVADESNRELRRARIEAHRLKWVTFREPFEELVGQKCWYTESRNPGNGDDVDHFRPKLGVTECPGHGGYWWVAFSWKNFRLSCPRANRLRKNPETGATQGKGNHFPLVVEAERWMSESALCLEQPLLLDPTNPLDPPMLTYGVDGRAALAPDFDNVPDAQARIEASRLYFHLDWPEFVEDRTALYGQIARRVEDGDRVAAAALDGREPAAIEALKSVAAELIRRTKPDQPYSRAALACIRVYRDKTWVQRTVLANIIPDGS